MRLPRVVILGGGFGGLAAANSLKHAPVKITLVDRNNHQTFQPLLYQVATAGLEAGDVGFPLRAALRRHRNTEVVMDEAESIDPDAQLVHLRSGETLGYEYLIVATGAEPSYFHNPEWRSRAPSLKSLRDAIEIRYRVLTAFEHAEQARDPEEQRESLCFVVVGGGPTGVELAGAIAELARHALRRDFRHIDTRRAQVILLEGGPALLPAYPVELQIKAKKQLESLGVQVRTSAIVQSMDESSVSFGDERILARTVLWAAGVKATPITRYLGVPLDRHGRVLVTPTLNPPGHPNVFVIGDLVALEQDGHPVPGLAAAAIQAGHYSARAIVHRLARKPLRPFHYWNKGELATIGRSRAVGLFPGGIKVSGLLAWLAYSAVHLFYLAGFRSRLSVFLTWAWSYLTYRRGARLIPGIGDGIPDLAHRGLPTTGSSVPGRDTRQPQPSH